MQLDAKWDDVRRWLRSLDPNDDPSAEPVTLPAIVALLLATGYSTYLFLRWKFQPMQDVGLHAAVAAVVADYHRAGSIYPPIYKLDLLCTNSFLYTVAGLLGKIFPASGAFRFTLSMYMFGVPFVTLYALRVFGRSAWGAVAAVPFTYNQCYVFGFANYLFAAPFAILAIPLFYRMLLAPTWKRVLAVALVMIVVFLSHVHVFLWTGVLLCLMALTAIVVTSYRAVLGRPTQSLLAIIVASAISVIPALLLLGRWYWRSKHPPADEIVGFAMEGADWAEFKRQLHPPSDLLQGFQGFVMMLKPGVGMQDRWIYVIAFLIGAVCMALRSQHKWKHPPVLELAAIVTMASYFTLPEFFAFQQVIGSRQIHHAMWFAPVFFTPVPWRVNALGRAFAIAGACLLPLYHFSYWVPLLKRFQREEVNGLEAVLDAAPPRLRLHYVNMHPDGKYFVLNSFWHVEKWYMIDKFGQTPENTARGSMQAVHYRGSYDPHRITNHSNDWPSDANIWAYHDLILTHHWTPNQAQLEKAEQLGRRLAKKGDWELWQKK